jgi:hypothetical protein
MAADMSADAWALVAVEIGLAMAVLAPPVGNRASENAIA